MYFEAGYAPELSSAAGLDDYFEMAEDGVIDVVVDTLNADILEIAEALVERRPHSAVRTFDLWAAGGRRRGIGLYLRRLFRG